MRSKFWQFLFYDSSLAFKVSHLHFNGWQSVDIASRTLIFNRNWGATKERLYVYTWGQNEEHRRRIKIQMHKQNNQQMLRRASQVTFVEIIYIKYYFIWENVVEWVLKFFASQIAIIASFTYFYSVFHWSAKLMLSKFLFFVSVKD